MKKKFWKKGSAEALGFICMAPTMVILVVMLVNFVYQRSFIEQLEYTAYVACRAATASESKKIGKKNAQAVAEANMLVYDTSINGNVSVTIQYVNPKTKKTVTKGKYAKWEKGNYILCTVKVKYKPIASFLPTSTQTQKIVMAIEYSG